MQAIKVSGVSKYKNWAFYLRLQISWQKISPKPLIVKTVSHGQMAQVIEGPVTTLFGDEGTKRSEVFLSFAFQLVPWCTWDLVMWRCWQVPQPWSELWSGCLLMKLLNNLPLSDSRWHQQEWPSRITKESKTTSRDLSYSQLTTFRFIILVIVDPQSSFCLFLQHGNTSFPAFSLASLHRVHVQTQEHASSIHEDWLQTIDRQFSRNRIFA